MHGINRYLKAPPHSKTFDSVKDSSFNDSNANFKAVLTESKRFGLGDVEHFPVINEVDRETLYTFMFLSPDTPTGLANKVQFDIRLYFCRRGIENMHSMTKCSFTIKTDIKTGLKYVTKSKDELTKNHRQSDKELVSGVMPESPGSVYCPVASYENYIRRLHPSNDRLWQKPLDSFSTETDVWYYNMPLGEKKLSTFMSELSKKCKLSIVYTNHSIRANGATVLSQNMYGSAQIRQSLGTSPYSHSQRTSVLILTRKLKWVKLYMTILCKEQLLLPTIHAIDPIVMIVCHLWSKYRILTLGIFWETLVTTGRNQCITDKQPHACSRQNLRVRSSMAM
ncbi:Hypothetical predicted protein [Mytilus galloprovincialis]|uniref:DUF3504 domain-containing protein n=2 Tax=Mytilus galloprovincialis TaxID=29158 RepID=A0A8B6F977_MYTGA|nr:Hypothetical predicted protein [Mytilus galloprovincialis]